MLAAGLTQDAWYQAALRLGGWVLPPVFTSHWCLSVCRVPVRVLHL